MCNKTSSREKIQTLLAALFLLNPALTRADGIAVDKVYDPYVQPLGKEIEWRGIVQQNSPYAQGDLHKHRLGVGASLSDTWFGEVYLIGERTDDESLEVEAYELEAKWQLTEQGEYAADWGLLFELEKERNEDAWEFATGILAAKEWGRWVGSANLFGIYEWGKDIDNELETRLSLQARYRFSPRLEPALELYSGQKSQGIGPVIMGTERLAVAQKLHWELGIIFGFDDDSPDQTLRALLEYEF